MKLPEYLQSTPRLIAVIVTIALVYLTVTKLVDSEDFVAIATLIFGYFFGARGSEASGGKTEQELKYEIEEKIKEEDKKVFDVEIYKDI